MVAKVSTADDPSVVGAAADVVDPLTPGELQKTNEMGQKPDLGLRINKY